MSALRKGLKAVGLGLLLLVAAGAGLWWWSGVRWEQIPELEAFLVKHGGKMGGATVGRACPTCRRGMFATRPLVQGEPVLQVPLELALPITREQLGDNAPAALFARDLFLRLHSDPGFNATWGSYWAALPAADQTFRAELFTDAHLAMLQSDDLAETARVWRGLAESIFDGTFNNSQLPAVRDVLPAGSDASVEAFKHVVALAFSRAFPAAIDEEQGVHLASPYLLPLFDMVNHAHDANAVYGFQNGSFFLVMTRNTWRGEEITLAYESEFAHRPDGQLCFYGFVEEREHPLLALIDLPDTFNGRSKVDPYEHPGGEFVTQAEHDRLSALLAGLPTTEAEDAALLANGTHTDWRDQELLRFRIARKRALRENIDKLAAALAAGQAAGQGQEGGPAAASSEQAAAAEPVPDTAEAAEAEAQEAAREATKEEL